MIVVTHAEDLARLADRVIHIRDGKLLDAPPTPGLPLDRNELHLVQPRAI